MAGSNNLKPFAPGQSGNPEGRPKGARNRLGEAFLDAMSADFETHGTAIIAKVRETEPAQYLKIVASLLPRQIALAPNAFDGVPDDELHALVEAVRMALRLGDTTATPAAKPH